MRTPPSTNGGNGRDGRGRFALGNPGGPGNPLVKRIAKLRAAMLAKITPGELAAVVAAMLRLAKGGDVAAARLVLSYAVGEPIPADIFAELDILRAAIAELGNELREGAA